MNSFKDYLKLYKNCVNSGTPDKGMTLKAFQRRASTIRGAIKLLMDQRDADVQKLYQEFNDAGVAKYREPLDKEVNGIIEMARTDLINDLEKVMAAKRDALDKANSAPTEEQLRLLQTLSMRSHLTAAELNAVAAKLNDNVPALRLLGDIAEKHNLSFPGKVADMDVIEHNLEVAEEYCRSMIDCLSHPELSYRQKCFYDYPQLKTEADAVFEPVDSTTFTVAPAPSIQKETMTNPNAVRVFLGGGENLASLAYQFSVSSEAIRKANPDYDFSNIMPGDDIVIPSGRMKLSNAPGFVGEDQVVPTYYDEQV